MKTTNKIIITILALVVSLSILSGFTLAVDVVAPDDLLQYDLGIRFEQDRANEKIVHVIMEMSDEDSVASFNLSTDIDIEEEANVEFKFNDTNLPEAKSELREAKVETITNVDGKGKKEKRLNVYYVGTKELNPINSNKFEIGTLEFSNISGDNTTLRIETTEDKSEASSVSHKYSTLAIEPFHTVLNENENLGNDPETNPPGGETDNPDNENGGNTGSQEGENGGNSENGQENNGGGNVIEKFINKMKTGANKSVTWAIITLIVLVIVAIVLKKNIIKKAKHSKK